MAARDAKLSYDSGSIGITPDKTYYPTIEIDLKKFPEFKDLQFKDTLKLNIGVEVCKISVDKYRKCLTFEVRTIEINDVDASYTKLVAKHGGVNEADISLANLTS